jgi:hypothetical protein
MSKFVDKPITKLFYVSEIVYFEQHIGTGHASFAPFVLAGQSAHRYYFVREDIWKSKPVSDWWLGHSQTIVRNRRSFNWTQQLMSLSMVRDEIESRKARGAEDE